MSLTRRAFLGALGLAAVPFGAAQAHHRNGHGSKGPKPTPTPSPSPTPSPTLGPPGAPGIPQITQE